MDTALDTRTKKIGAFVNGNNEKTIWDAMLNEMVQRYPQAAARSPPPCNVPTINYMGIEPPARVTNDDVTLIIDNLNAEKEDTGEEPE